MIKQVSPLIKRTKLLPAESLSSLLVRLTALNSYEALSILKGLIFESPDTLTPLKDSLEAPLKPATYEVISSISLLDIPSLYQCTLHRFASTLTPLNQAIPHMQLSDGFSASFFPEGRIPKQLRPRSMAQFCPHCLGEKAHYTLKWAPVAISTCLQHKCLLVDRCYECEEQVSPVDVAKARCELCQADLSKVPTISIQGDRLGLSAQQVILSWLMECTTLLAAQSSLPNQPVRVLYWVLEDLQHFVRELKSKSWNYIHRLDERQAQLRDTRSQFPENEEILTPYESYQLYTTAYKAMMNWPESFFDFLHQYGARNNSSYQKSLTKQNGKLIPGIISANLGSLYTRWLSQQWKRAEYAFLRDAVSSYIAENYWFSDMSELKSFCKQHPEFTEKCMYATTEDAADLLDLSPEAVEFLIGDDYMLLQESEGKGIKVVKREKVFALRDSQNKPSSLQGVAVRLGLPANTIKALARMGMFAEGESPTRELSLDDVTSIGEALFLKKVSKYAQELSIEQLSTKEYINVAKAERLISIADLSGITLFLQIAMGNLRAYVPNKQSIRLDGLLFLCTDIQVLATKYAVKKPFLLSQEKVTKMLSVKETTLDTWVRKGLLQPEAIYGIDAYFEPALVEIFLEKYVFAEEALKLLGLDINKPHDVIWESPLSLSNICASGFGVNQWNRCIFDRKKLIQWRAERLTFDEAIRSPKIDRDILQEQIRNGKILSIDFINDEPTWLSKQEFLALERSLQTSKR